MSRRIDELRDQLAILELEPGVSWQQVKDRYRFLAKVWHPDRFGADLRARTRAEQQFKAVNEAYQWLLQNRHLVDSAAEDGKPDGGPEKPGATRPGPESPEPHPHGAGRRPRPGAPREERAESTASTVEKFLWGVIATFAFIAILILVTLPRQGWMRRPNVEPGRDLSAAAEDAESTVTDPSLAAGSPRARWVTSSRLYVRTEPSREAPVVRVLERGSRVRVRPGNGTWLAMVGDDGRQVGWLHRDYLSDTPPSSASSPAAGTPEREAPVDFETFARANPPPASPSAAPPAADGESERELELIRGAWKPKNPDPFDRARDATGSAGAKSELEHWSGEVVGQVPDDLPRVTIRLFQDVEPGRPIGAAAYWGDTASCSYRLELREQVQDWIRTEQVAETSGCAPQGEVWFLVTETSMTAIWHRLDGSRWFTSRLRRD